MSKNPIARLKFCDDKDNDFTDTNDDPAQRCRIMTVYQGGQVDGHLLKFQNGTLISTASNDDTKAAIRIRNAFDGDPDDEFENWIISDPESLTKALKLKCDDDGKYSFTVEENNGIAGIDSLTKAKAELGEFVFKKFSIPGENRFYLTSFKKNKNDKSLLLAVDEHGQLRMDNPPLVDENDSIGIADDEKNLFAVFI